MTVLRPRYCAFQMAHYYILAAEQMDDVYDFLSKSLQRFNRLNDRFPKGQLNDELDMYHERLELFVREAILFTK